MKCDKCASQPYRLYPVNLCKDCLSSLEGPLQAVSASSDGFRATRSEREPGDVSSVHSARESGAGGGWIGVEEDRPDDDITVLIALSDGEVWTGFLDAGQWRFESADPVETPVTHWMHFPPPPARSPLQRGERAVARNTKVTHGRAKP